MKNAGLVIGGLAALGGVIAIAVAGGQKKTSTVFAAPDPNAVAAAENGVAAQIGQINNLALGRMKIASDTIISLAGAQQVLTLGQLATAANLESTRITSGADVARTGLQTSSAETIAGYDMNSAIETARQNNDATVRTADILGRYNQAIEQIGANRDITVAGTNAGRDVSVASIGANRDVTVANTNANRDVSVAGITSNAATQIASTTAAADVQKTNAQVSGDVAQANAAAGAAKHGQTTSMISSIIGTVSGFFKHL